MTPKASVVCALPLLMTSTAKGTTMPDLETRRLGRTELKPKAIGLGCAFLGSPQRVSDDDGIATVRNAIDRGLNFIDTSAAYGGGESERRVGLALQDGYREKVYLQTKAGTHPDHRHDYSAKTIRWTVENSLRLLKTDYIDSVLIHDPRDTDDPFASGCAQEELLKMKSEGLIGHTGIGCRSHDFHRRAIETGHCDLLITFLDYTLLSQTAAETTIPLALKNDVGLILASVQGMGLLAGPKPDPEFSERRYPGQADRAIAMWEWCNTRNISIRRMALQYCLAAPLDGNGMLLVGPATPSELDEVLTDATADVDRDLWDAFEQEFGVGI